MVFVVRAFGFVVRSSAAAVLSFAMACAPATPRDYVPETHDVRSNEADAAPAPKPGGYAYVARRAHGAIGLAGVRAMSQADAERVVDAAADEMERCARAQQAEGKLVDGAARLVVAGSPRGHAQIGDMEIAPGGPVAANALLCLVAPLKTLSFPKGTSERTPAILLEATWGPVRPEGIGAPRDAGGDM
jgi:hypothetical protein